VSIRANSRQFCWPQSSRHLDRLFLPCPANNFKQTYACSVAICEDTDIKYEGPKSKNPLAFKHYNPSEKVEGKTMKDHLRFSVTYWHTFRGMGADMFGVGTAQRPWEDGTNSVEMAKKRARVAFQFMEKLGVPFYAFHDRDVAPEGKNLRESNKNLDAVVKVLKEEQKRTGIGCFGAPPACSFIRVSCTARARVATPTSSRSQPPR
jgi:xylose isomerase